MKKWEKTAGNSPNCLQARPRTHWVNWFIKLLKRKREHVFRDWILKVKLIISMIHRRLLLRKDIGSPLVSGRMIMISISKIGWISWMAAVAI